jgi:hypothetical protein
MPTIRIEYEVPDDNCVLCEQSYIFSRFVGRVCIKFDRAILQEDENGKYQRCQACIDATVKEGVYAK